MGCGLESKIRKKPIPVTLSEYGIFQLSHAAYNSGQVMSKPLDSSAATTQTPCKAAHIANCPPPPAQQVCSRFQFR
jgi:hypothetical protein